MSLPPDVEASYSAIIDGILAVSNLQTISAKRIRKGLQAKVDVDLTPQKEAITNLIMSRFDKAQAQQPTAPSPPEPTPTVVPTNGIKKETTPKPKPLKSSKSPSPFSSAASSSPKKRAKSTPPDDSELSDPVDTPPPKKKQKKTPPAGRKSIEEDDAAYAARLQAEENGRMRSTRGGNSKKKAAPVKGAAKRQRKKKSANKVREEDDSELENGEKKEVKRNGGFHKPMLLSTPLSELLGEAQLSRPQCVKQIWAYIKERDLQDPADKRQIRCDDALRAVFKSDRIHMFTMNKILNQNLYAVDE
ncbi:SWIB-domain-containing protein [Aulographum hederae CBS 113979]|uniref:SWIB-domain-containing protein n=1 Tax=Aulographum hederae CBS 113979 TaxID=1176131 RepID=A0A6G1GM13_9PEZI|nr:SWIB-domain-containing protein [Aulographum hederae CBS 113979]